MKNQTSDYIEYNKAYLKGKELLWSEKQSIIGFYIIFSINTGLRVSDILNIKHSDLMDLKQGDSIRVIEKKTRKPREIQVNTKILQAYSDLKQAILKRSKHINPDSNIFISQKGTVYANVSINRILKEIFKGEARNISTHSLRKTFGRRVYDQNGQSENALMYLSVMLCHSSLAITRIYLGLRQETINSIYMNL